MALPPEDEGAGLGRGGRVDRPTVADGETVDEVETGELLGRGRGGGGGPGESAAVVDGVEDAVG